MRRFWTFTLAAGLALVALPVLSSESSAHQRTYVSGNGTDNTDCSISNPCRTFDRAVSLLMVNGEVNCLDAGSYGPVTITKSVTIDCKEVPATIQASSGNGITINIPASSNDPLRTVRLRGFTLSGAGQSGSAGTRTGAVGLRIVDANAVFVEHLVISDFTQQGIYDSRSSGQTKLFVLDTVVRNNGGGGIVCAGSNVNVAVLDNVRSENNLNGLAVGAGNNVTVNRSVFSGNSVAGVEADIGARVHVNGSVVSNNNFGLHASGGIRASNNDIDFNNLAINGAITSLGNNRFNYNQQPGSAPAVTTGAAPDVGQF